jgi:hypothetical protein
VNRKLLYICGMLSPLVYIFMTILGGALRPGYSHISDTVSELFAPGSPNKALLDSIHLADALLSILFGIGVYLYIRSTGHSTTVGLIGAAMIIAIGVVNIFTATLFPQDAWGTPMTFPGQMHKILVLAVMLPFSVLSTLFVGIWTRQAGVLPGFAMHSYVTIAVVVLLGGVSGATMGGPWMGVSERLAVLAGFQWTFTLALRLFLLP